MTAEDRFCSDCGFADYCMRERSCYRRDRGEIRSPYSESARGALTPTAQPDAGASSSSCDAPRPEKRHVLVLGTPLAMTLSAAFRINEAGTLQAPSSFNFAQDDGVSGSPEHDPSRCEAERGSS